jgi:hypothetical protein
MVRSDEDGDAGDVVRPSQPTHRQASTNAFGGLAVIVLWNTIYIDAALQQLHREGFEVRDKDVARLSPLGHEHINMLGRYAFSLPDKIARAATPQDPESRPGGRLNPTFCSVATRTPHSATRHRLAVAAKTCGPSSAGWSTWRQRSVVGVLTRIIRHLVNTICDLIERIGRCIITGGRRTPSYKPSLSIYGRQTRVFGKMRGATFPIMH